MSKKSERAMDIAVKAILFITEDESMKIMWKNMEEKDRVLVKNKIATYASSQLEEYAGSIRLLNINLCRISNQDIQAQLYLLAP